MPEANTDLLSSLRKEYGPATAPQPESTNSGDLLSSLRSEYGPADTSKPRGTLAEMGRQFGAGTVVDIPEMTGKAIQAFSDEGSPAYQFGKEMRENAEARAPEWEPDLRNKNEVQQALVRGTRAAPASLAAAAPAFIPGVGPYIAAGVTGAGFGGAQYQDTYEKLRGEGISEAEAKEAALGAAFTQGGGEIIANRLTGGLLGAGKDVAAKTIGELTGKIATGASAKEAAKQFGKAYATELVGEPATEIAQDVGTEAIERAYGAQPTADYGDIAYQSGTTALAMAAMLGLPGAGGHYANKKIAERIDTALNDPETADSARLSAVQGIYNRAKNEGIQDADQWYAGALEDIRNKAPVRRDSGVAQPISESPAVEPELAAEIPVQEAPTEQPPPVIADVTPQPEVEQPKRPVNLTEDQISGIDDFIKRTDDKWSVLRQTDPEKAAGGFMRFAGLDKTAEALGVLDTTLGAEDQMAAIKQRRAELEAQKTPGQQVADEISGSGWLSDTLAGNVEALDANIAAKQAASQSAAQEEADKYPRSENIEDAEPKAPLGVVDEDGNVVYNDAGVQYRKVPATVYESLFGEKPRTIEEHQSSQPQGGVYVTEDGEIVGERPVEEPDYYAPESLASRDTTELESLISAGNLSGPKLAAVNAELLRRKEGEENAEPITSPAPLDGGGGAQPGLREEGGNPAVSGAGIPPSGQEIGNIQPESLETPIPQEASLNDESQNAAPQETAAETGSEEVTESGKQKYVKATSLAEAADITERNKAALPEEQVQDGDYQRGFADFDGLHIAIENKAGSYRSGKDANGKAWRQQMHSHYGEIGVRDGDGTLKTGADGDLVDVFVNPSPRIKRSPKVYIVDQVNKDGSFDEHKIVLGYLSKAKAKQAYLENYEAGWAGLGAITEMPMPEFKNWLLNENPKLPVNPNVGKPKRGPAKERINNRYQLTGNEELQKAIRKLGGLKREGEIESVFGEYDKRALFNNGANAKYASEAVEILQGLGYQLEDEHALIAALEASLLYSSTRGRSGAPFYTPEGFEKFADRHGIAREDTGKAELDSRIQALRDTTLEFLGQEEANFLQQIIDRGGITDITAQKDITDAESGQYSRPAALPEKINVDGIDRRTRNSNGNPIAQTEEGVRNFWKWFGDSKVVDGQGRPQIIYHGTTHDFSTFDVGKAGEKDHGWYGTGVYMTPDSETASAYANYEEDRSGQHVMPLYAKIEAPFDWEQDMSASKTKGQSDEFTRVLRKSGHDGVFVENVYAAPEHAKRYEIVAFSPEQVKSAVGNNGYFDPSNADINFSRPDRAAGSTQRVLAEFAKDDEIFKHPVSDAKTLEGVMADVAPLFKRKPLLDKYSRISEGNEGAKVTVYSSPTGRPIVIKENGGKVWIDVSNLKSGDNGGAIYAAVGNYANNAGVKFIDDPDGVSVDAVFRRPMHMLSLALRFGGTDFLDVSDNFEKESLRYGLGSLAWNISSQEMRMARLLARNINPVMTLLPDLQDIYYDFRTNQFKNDKFGGVLAVDWANQRAVREDARRAQIGETTIRRVVFLKSLASSSGEEKSRLLEELGNDGRLAGGVSLAGIFSRQNPAAGFQRLTAEEAKQHLSDNFGVGIENLSRQGVLNFTDGKESWPEIAQNGARGDEEAVYINGKVYVDLSATGRGRLNAVVLHEIGEHFGLRRMLGNQAYQSLQQQITNRAKIAGSKAEAVWNEVKANYGHLEEGSDLFVAEVIAKLGESNSKAPWYRRLISQIKAFLMRMGLARSIVAGTITEADMHDLLVTSLRSAAAGKMKDKPQYFGGQEVMASRPEAAKQDDFIPTFNKATWSPNRIAGLMSSYAYSGDDSRTKAFAGYITPDMFLSATTTDAEDLERIESESRELNTEELAGESQPIVLWGYLENGTFATDGHEGRHRMVALKNAGIKWVPVVFNVHQGTSLPADMGRIFISGQKFGPSRGRGFSISSTIPLNYENYDRIKAVFGGEASVQFSRPAVLDQFMQDKEGEPTIAAQAIRKLDEKWDAVAKQRFAALSVLQMTEYAKHIMPGLSRYSELLQDLKAEKSAWIRKADRLVSETWKKLPMSEQRKLAKVMHDSTLADTDVSKAWTGYTEGVFNNKPTFFAYTQEALSPARKAKLGQAAIDLGAVQLSEGDKKDPSIYRDNRGYAFRSAKEAAHFASILDEHVKEQRNERAIKGWPDANPGRFVRYQEIQKEYEALPDKSKMIYSEANQQHNDIFRERLATLESRIKDAVANGQTRKALLAKVREQFESGSVNWYYAPLSRFGKEWFYGTTAEGKKWFATFESEGAKREAIERFKERGGTLIGDGTTFSNIEKLEGQAASDSFILDIQKRIDGVKELDPKIGEALKDQIYQMYLATLPDVSMRHNNMHRSNTLGFDEDALQAFSNSMHHGSTQLANMKFGREMKGVLTQHIEAAKLAMRPDLREPYRAENKAAEMIADNWDKYSAEGYLEDLQRNLGEIENPPAAEVVSKAIQLRNRLRGMTEAEARKALATVSSDNDALLAASELIQPKDTKRASEVLDELLLAYDHMVNYNSGAMDKVASGINQVNFVGMLGFSLSSGMVNLLQTPGVAMPIAIGKFGYGRTVKEFNRALSEFMSALVHKRWDIDGNVSISALIQDQFDSSNDPAERGRLKDELEAMEIFKNGDDISRTRTFDIMGIGQEGATYGGRFHDFAVKAGWMFHHGERLNREVTLMATYRLARQSGMNSDDAIVYARYVNNRAHLDYSSENAARIFRGPLAKIALQFKKYQQGMLFLWTKTAIDGWKTLKREDFAPTQAGALLFREAQAEQKESRRTFMALLAMQTSLAGALGLPMMGMLGVYYEMIANAFSDDDEPRDFEKDLRLGLANLFGDTAAETFAKGAVNTFTPINLASRLDQADVFFKAPLKEAEGRDAATQYVAEVFGPTGGTIQKTWQGLSLLADGHVMRGAEQLSPKFVGDIIKAARFTAEGAKTLDNMPLKDMSAFEDFAQALGFGSSALERRYAERGYAKGEEAAIKETRTKIMRDAAWARIKGETVDMTAIRAWNLKHPEKKILAENISASVKGIKESTATRKEKGYAVDPKLEYLYEENEVMD